MLNVNMVGPRGLPTRKFHLFTASGRGETLVNLQIYVFVCKINEKENHQMKMQIERLSVVVRAKKAQKTLPHWKINNQQFRLNISKH